MWWARELASCFKFLFIKGDQGFWHSKRVYEIILPAACAAAFTGLYVWKPDAFSSEFLKGFSEKLFQFMVFVVPFHLAALTAVATFDRPTLDEGLRGTDAGIMVWSNADNGWFLAPLSLRQYISLLFGYLCSIGVVFILVYLFGTAIDLSKLLDLGSHPNIVRTIVFALAFFTMHYTILSIYAVTFLFGKINNIGSATNR